MFHEQRDWRLHIEKDGIIIGHFHPKYGAFMQAYWNNKHLKENSYKIRCTACEEKVPQWTLDLLALAGKPHE